MPTSLQPRTRPQVNSDIEPDALRQRQFARVIDGVGGASHISFPAVGAGFASSTGFFFTTERAADLGAGGGYLAIELVTRNPGIHAIDLYEAEARALEVARLNLPTVQRPLTVGFHWHDVRTGLPSRYDVIISNPPFHHGRADAPELGHGFIIAAANALNPSGQLWLVANRHLPYEAVLGEHFAQVRVVVVRDGFKVIAAQLSW